MDGVRKNRNYENIKDTEILTLIREMFIIFKKIWWICAIIVLVSSVISLGVSIKKYKPMYKASATFTVETYTNQNGYTFFSA